MSLLNGKEYLLTTLPPKYDISTATNQILLGGQKLKRLGKYEDLDPFLCDKLTITVNIDNNYMKISQE